MASTTASSSDPRPNDENGYICTKRTPLQHRQQTRLPATCFRDLVHHSNVFVDKTLLIKSILENESVISLTYPPKWGKTLAVDMMKEFFELQVTADGSPVKLDDSWASKFFISGQIVDETGSPDDLSCPPLIADYSNIIEHHLGKYPVIYVDLSTVQPISKTYQGFFHAFRKTISTVYRYHDHMVSTLQKLIAYNQPIRNTSVAKMKFYLKIFEEHLEQTQKNAEEITSSLLYLCEILRWRFSTQVFLIIDNYDAWVTTSYIHINDPRVTNFYTNFMSKTLVDNTYIRNAVLTGTLGFKICFPQARLSHVTDYNLLEKNIEPYFGFTRTETEQLLRFCHQQPNEAETWYGGYELGDQDDRPELTVGNPWSLVNFANTGKTERYWCRNAEFNVLPQILKFKTLRGMFERLVCRDGFFEVHHCRLATHSFGTLDLFSKLVDFICKNEGTLSNDLCNTIVTLLYVNGYITRYKKPPHHLRKSTKLHVRLPNREICDEIVNEMKLSHNRSLLSALESITRIPNSLIQFIESDGGNSSLKQRLEDDLDEFRTRVNVNVTYNGNKNDPYIHSAPVLISVLVSTNLVHPYGCWMLLHGDHDSKPKTLVLSYKADCCIVFELEAFYDEDIRLQVELRKGADKKYWNVIGIKSQIEADRYKLCHISGPN